MINVNIFANGTGQLKKKTEFCGYFEVLLNRCVRKINICSMAKGNLDVEEVVA